MDMDVEREEDLPPRQGVMVELPAGMEGRKGALEEMFEQRPQNQNDKPDSQEEAFLRRLSRRGTPPEETDRHQKKEGQLDLRVPRAAEKRKEEIREGGKTVEEPGDSAIEGSCQDQPEKQKELGKRERKSPSQEGSLGGGGSVHERVSHSGIGRWRSSPKPAFPRRIARLKARKKTAFRNLTGGPSPGSQSRGSVSVQQIRHMRGRSS